VFEREKTFNAFDHEATVIGCSVDAGMKINRPVSQFGNTVPDYFENTRSLTIFT
jgi:hypothetical protein